MSDCDAGNSAPSADCSSAADTSTNCWSSVEPPPDYSTCVSHPETGSSNHHSGTTDTTQHSHHWHPISNDDASEALATGHTLHGAAASAPFLNLTPASENRHDGYVPGFNSYNPQPPYNPSYKPIRPTTPRPNVYGRKTIVLTRTDAQNSARKRKMMIGLCLGLTIGSLIPIVTLIYIFNAPSRHSSSKSVMNNYVYEPKNDWQYDSQIFNAPRHTTVDPYLTNKYKNKYDDTYWKKENSDTPSDPFFNDRYKDTVTEKPWKEKTEEDIFREMGIDVPDLTKIYENTLNEARGIDKDFQDPVIKPITMSDEMKDLLGIPRDKNTKEKKPPIWK